MQWWNWLVLGANLSHALKAAQKYSSEIGRWLKMGGQTLQTIWADLYLIHPPKETPPSSCCELTPIFIHCHCCCHGYHLAPCSHWLPCTARSFCQASLHTHTHTHAHTHIPRNPLLVVTWPQVLQMLPNASGLCVYWWRRWPSCHNMLLLMLIKIDVRS